MKRFVASMVSVMVVTLTFAGGSASADVLPDKPGQTPQHGPPLSSGGRGANVTHCNAESGETGIIVYSVQKGEVLHDSCSGPV